MIGWVKTVGLGVEKEESNSGGLGGYRPFASGYVESTIKTAKEGQHRSKTSREVRAQGS